MLSVKYQNYEKLDADQKRAINKFVRLGLYDSPKHCKKLESWADHAWEARASKKMRILFLRVNNNIEILCCCASSQAKKLAKAWPRKSRRVTKC